MDHYLVLVLTEVLNWVALIEVAIKGQNHELLGKFLLHMALEKRELNTSMVMALNLW